MEIACPPGWARTARVRARDGRRGVPVHRLAALREPFGEPELQPKFVAVVEPVAFAEHLAERKPEHEPIREPIRVAQREPERLS